MTESGLNLRRALTIGLLFLIPLVAVISFVDFPEPALNRPNDEQVAVTNLVVLKNRQFFATVADEPVELSKGLSGRSGLGDNEAMLFVFSNPASECFWMKDMLFNIDILWFDIDKKLIHQQRNVSPDTYPRSFCPNQPAKYVLELKAGTADQLDLPSGTVVELPNL